MFEKHLIIGNLGRDPEMRYTPSGVPVTNFSVAVNKRYTKDGERFEKTTWYKVVAWRKLAETCGQYLAKGRTVLVEGDISVEAYTDREGNPAAKLVLTATNIQFLGSGKGDAGSGDEVPAGATAEEEDDLPF